MAFLKTSIAIQKPTTFEFESLLPGDATKPPLPKKMEDGKEEEEEEEEISASSMPTEED